MDDHPVLLQLESLRNALAKFQDEAHASAVKLQHHSLSTSRALDRVHALEHENSVLNDELYTLRGLSSNLTSVSAKEIQINQLTLSLRTLNEKVSATEDLLAQRTQDLTNALAELTKSRVSTDAAYELASRIRGREEALRSHEGELQLKLQLAEERAKMSERAVGEYADLVRKLEGRNTGPYNNNAGRASSQTLVHPDDKEDKGTVEGLLREFAVEREDLQSQLSSAQHELVVIKSQYDAQTKIAESALAELAQLRYQLQLLERDDTTAAKMVSRYMKFSQQSTNNLQTTLQTLTSRHTATLTSLTTHTHTLTHTVQTLESLNTRLLASLDDIGNELLKESFGRRREVKVRMRLVRREERVVEGLRRWLRRAGERVGKAVGGTDTAEDEAEGVDVRMWLDEMVQDAKILVDELDSPLHLTLDHPDDQDHQSIVEVPVSGPLARLIAIQSTINELVDELGREQSRRVRAEEALVHYEVQLQQGQELWHEREHERVQEKLEGETESPSPPPPPLPPKNLNSLSPSQDDHTDPASAPPPEMPVLIDVQPQSEPELAHISTIISQPNVILEVEEEEATPIPTNSSLPLPPPTIFEEIAITVATTTTSPTPPGELSYAIQNLTTSAVTAGDDEVTASPGVVAANAEEVSTDTADVSGVSEGTGGIVEKGEKDEARADTYGVIGDYHESTPPPTSSSFVETGAAVPPIVDVLEKPQKPILTIIEGKVVLADVEGGVGKAEGAMDPPPEGERPQADGGDSITAEVAEVAGEPDSNQAQQDLDSEVDAQPATHPSLVPPEPSASATLETERESAQDLESADVPKVIEMLGNSGRDPSYTQEKEEEDTATDILCALEPPAIQVEPIPLPVPGAYTETPNGVADPALPVPHVVVTQPAASLPITSLELDTTTSISIDMLPTILSPAISPPPPVSLSPPPAPQQPQHPLLYHLQKAHTRYDYIQRAFHDCHIALESLKSSLHSTSTTTKYPTHAIPQSEWFKAVIQRLDDYTEDIRVELEIRISDEEVLGRGYEALLSVPGALDSHHQGETAEPGETLVEVEAQILAFVEGTEPGIQKALRGFQKKLEDLEHDVAAVKRAVHDLQGVSSAPPFSEHSDTSPTSDAQSTGGGGWTSWIPGRVPPRPTTPTPGPAPTFGNIMTSRHRTPIRRTVSAFGLADSSHRAEEEGDIIKNLNLRISMPDLSFVFSSPSSSSSYQDSTPSSSSGFGLGLGVGVTPRSRTVSTMYMLGMGMGGMRGRSPGVSSPLQRRVVSAVPRLHDALARMGGSEREGLGKAEDVDVD